MEGSPVQMAGSPHSIPPLHKAWKILFQSLRLNHSGLGRVNIQKNTKDLESICDSCPSHCTLEYFIEMRIMLEISHPFLSSEQSLLGISLTHLSSAWVYRIELRGGIVDHQNMQEESAENWRLLLLKSSLKARKHGSPYGEIHRFYPVPSTKDNCSY